MIRHQHQALEATDKHSIQLQYWHSGEQVRCVIQLVHGLGEYGGRYEEFAAAAVARGYAVCVHDHRGHGSTRDPAGFFSSTNGWEKVTSDVGVVNEFVREQWPDKPVILLGHSMGSYIAQAFAMHYSDRLAGMILSASTFASKAQLLPATLLARVETWRLGAHRSSALLDRLGFSKFNKPFEPARTDHDWISRDTDRVDAYIADPLCGGPYCSGLWRDLLDGLLQITSDRALMRIRSDLPILIMGGSADPVGGDKGMTRLAMHYAQTFHQRLKVKIYPDGRHEMLNETNRSDVTDDLLNWIATTTRTSR